MQSLQAQVIPDRTLGAASSVVTPQASQSLITGGALRGNSLFHSFQRFNINAGNTVRFNPPINTTNIFSRVTGTTASNIQGTLGVIGNANLFLLNPNGIFFGPNAQLDLSGSFAASTANRFQFGTAAFSAVTANPAPLLTISAPIGMQYGENAPDRLIRNEANLILPSQQQLTFDAGTIEQVGNISIPAGTVELRGQNLSLAGGIDTSSVNNQTGILRLSSPTDLTIQATGNLTNQNISQALQNNQLVIQSDRDLNIIGGISSISPNPLTLISGNNLRLTSDGSGPVELAGNTTLQSGGDMYFENSLLVTPQFPNPLLTLQATGTIFVNPITIAQNEGFELIQLTGDRGLFSISGQSLTMQRGSIRTLTQSRKTPEINIFTEQDVTIIGSGHIATIALSEQIGSNINIRTNGSVKLLQLTGIVSRPGISGITAVNSTTSNISVQAADTILLQAGTVQTESNGKSGDINLSARKIILDGTNGQSLITTNTSQNSLKDAGDITLNATESIELIGNQPQAFTFPNQVSLSVSDIFLWFGRTTVHASAFGRGASGVIRVNTDRLILRDGVILANIAGVFDNVGTAGDILINANDISLSGLATISSATVGLQNAGNVELQSRQIQLDRGASIAVSTVGLSERPKSGDAGSLTIKTDILNVAGGSVISAHTEDGGAGGTLAINATSVNITGSASENGFPSALLTDASDEAIGKGGELKIQTDSLQVLDGGQIRASTRGAQDAGNLKITADQITVSGVNQNGVPSTLEAQSTGSGQAGELDITANTLIIRDRAQGTTQSLQGSGGDINLVLRDLLLLRRAGKISSTAGIEGFGGDGGNINIRADAIVAPPTENADITANAFGGSGGNITIQTNTLLGLKPQSQLTNQSDITASSELGIDGQISIDLFAAEPKQDLPILSNQRFDPNQKISTVCNTLASSRFIISGRGGIPTDPRQQISSSAIIQDWRLPTNSSSASSPRSYVRSKTPSLVEAQTWRKNNQGKIQLITTNPQIASPPHITCHNLSNNSS